MNGGQRRDPALVPIYAPGKEPLPPGVPEEERPQIEQMMRYQSYMTMAMESCATKAAFAGVGGMFLFFKVVETSHSLSQVSVSVPSSPSCQLRSRMKTHFSVSKHRRE